MTRPLLHACVVVVVAGCATAPPPAGEPPEGSAGGAAAAREARDLDVDVSVLPDDAGRVGGVALRLCPSPGSVWPKRIAPEHRRALKFLVSAVDDDGRALPVDGEGVVTQALGRKGAPGCARIVVDVGRLADAVADKDLALRAGDDVVITPDLWLWRAEPLESARLFVKLDTAPFDALVPWSTESADGRGRLVVDRATYALRSDAVFGKFDVEEVAAAGARFRIARLGDGRAPRAFTSWLTASAHAVAALGPDGRFPLPVVNVLVVPTPRAARPIVVAFFSRGGGPTATVIVGADDDAGDGSRAGSDDISATGRWALTHELAHAWLPPVKIEDAWLNEGLATWHQELLARRAGLIADDLAWWRGVVQGLTTGRERAAADGLSVEDASAQMHASGAYQHAYWAGVGVVLIAEVRARERGASVDDLVLALRKALPVDDKPRAAKDLLALAGAQNAAAATAAAALTEAYRASARKPFPDVAPVLKALGVVVDERTGEVSGLDDGAPLAAIRKSIVTGRPGTGSDGEARAGSLQSRR